MNYDALNEAEPAGEVLLRGPQLFSGYYKQVGLAVFGDVSMLPFCAVIQRCLSLSLRARSHCGVWRLPQAGAAAAAVIVVPQPLPVHVAAVLCTAALGINAHGSAAAEHLHS
jgi:hypothetical protein